MARPIVLILSCGRDRQYHQQARNTWLKDKIDYKFILGDSEYNAQPDELIVQAGDGYWQVASKIKKAFEYAHTENYSHVFKCDIDTYCYIPRLLNSRFEQYDWIGNGMPYGGSGYWLSQKAIEVLLDKPTDRREGEDYWVARNLRVSGFEPFQDKRYWSYSNLGPEPNNDLITSHWYSERGFDSSGDRIIKSKERLDLIPILHSKANGS